MAHVAPGAAPIEAWMEAFAAAVRSAGYERGSALFDPSALGFGTVAGRADGLERLEAEQWRKTWGSTRGFRFDLGDARIEIAGELAWVASTWSSAGFDAAGAPFLRVGRATLVLRRSASGWRAVHTHFSLRPDAADAP